ncbi:Ecr family regulatory small membrane protein [Kosakonia pseudosacchari]|uniref:Uncharacterized protein n=1 Tax=Kosakonia pseudosacchari TaxID=1646340 RepID=A0ABX4IIZ9_9ENTR|nr:Ecr family regulatory small membrane protein [Kosakonia pseudosacchari]PDO82483.1 hypothetical protein BK796_22785 [Kosakonia pseudosacchari]
MSVRKQGFLTTFEQVMDKTALILLLLAVVVLVVGLWSIFSETLWVVASFLETLLYPTISTPE